MLWAILAAISLGGAYLMQTARESDARLTLARTVWGEARNQGEAGMRAVAAVVMNRVGDPRWPDTVAGVCKQHTDTGVYQFTAWAPTNPNRDKMLGMTAESSGPAWDTAWRIAGKALDGTLIDPTGGATHYVNPVIAGIPWWAEDMTRKATIGDHVFFA